MSASWADVTRQVIARAGERCAYCRMHQSLQGATFHVEHITPKVAGRADTLDNLALACPSCNLTKSSRVAAVDPETGQPVLLFNPRPGRWGAHFTWDGPRVRGTTPVGRALVAAFDLNCSRRMPIREAEAHFDLFPPDSNENRGRSPPA